MVVESKMHIGSWPNSSSQRLNQERETHSYCEASLYEHQLRVDKAERMSMIHVIVLKTAFKDGTAETSEEVGQFELRYA
uniref:Uncharacterized protein n=1 Tax=Vespula pensylvanica TaxID=30213 RepID=A0A834UGT5_VESPE|nr:hypothetical protein H0235_000828 [Vespula pensylvanica]